MVVIVLTACPAGVRGDLSRWLEEISPGVFVGHLNHRLREKVWNRVKEGAGSGRALLVWSTRGAQRIHYDAFGHAWLPTDFEGLVLMMRPNGSGQVTGGRGEGWSTAFRLRTFGREVERRKRGT